MKFNFTETTLERPITADELKGFSKEYLYNGIRSELGRKIIADSVINNFNFKEAIEVANDTEYSIQVIEEELKSSLRRAAGVSLILAGFSMAGENNA